MAGHPDARPRRRRTFARVPPAALARAIALLRRGYGTEAAATAVGFTGRALRQHLAARGTDARTVRGGGATLINRRPCRFCDNPVKPPVEVCGADDCRDLAWAALPEEERERRAAAAWSPQVAAETRYHRHANGRRLDLHLLLPARAVAQLHEQAARRGVSISRLVAETLADAGLIDDA